MLRDYNPPEMIAGTLVMKLTSKVGDLILRRKVGGKEERAGV